MLTNFVKLFPGLLARNTRQKTASRRRREFLNQHRQIRRGQIEGLEDRSLMAAFTDGNLAVILAASSSANNTTMSVVEVNTTTAGQTPTNIIAIEGATGANALRVSGSATSTLYASRSADGTLFSFTGHNATTTTGNANVILPRGVGTLNAAGNFNLATTYTGASGSQTRSATTLNGTDWFIADQNGIYTNGASAASPTGNVRGIKPFGGNVYTMQTSSTATVIQVSTVSAATGGTIAGLPGLTNNASAQDFYLIKSGDNGNTFDVLYVMSATSNTAGTIAKYSLVDTNANAVLGDAGDLWTANGTYTTAFGGFGIAAADNGNGAVLYVTTGLGAQAANSVLKTADTAGYNAAINITTANNVTLYTAGAGTTLKGLDFAPSSGVTTGTVTSPTSTAVTDTTATLGGNVTAGTGITERGLVYSLTSANADPLIGGSGVIKSIAAGTTTGVFTTNVSGLTASSGYTFKAYVISASGTSYSSAAAFSTQAPAAAHQAPQGTDKTVTFNEDATFTFAAADFGFSDPNDTPADSFSRVKITTLPVAGTLTLGGTPVAVGDFVTVANIPNLVFTPVANANGSNYASFTFQVEDNGSTANGGLNLDGTANTLTFNVTAINDAPAGTDKTVSATTQAGYVFVAADFGLTDPNDVPANTLLAVKITTLPTVGTLRNNGAAVSLGQFIPVADITAGKLVFTAAGGATATPNYATFTFQVQDNGGVTGGGIDLDASANLVTINLISPTQLQAGDIALIGYTTTGSPDSITLLVLRDLAADTTFFVSDNEVGSGGTTFNDLAEGEIAFTVKPGQTILAGTVIKLPWGAVAVSTSTYDWGDTTGVGLGNSSDDLYVYTAPDSTALTPTAFIYGAKLGTGGGGFQPTSLTAGTNWITPTGPTSRYKTSGVIYTGTKTELLASIGDTANNWEAVAPVSETDWTFTVSSAVSTTTALTNVSPPTANQGDVITFVGTVIAGSGTATPTGTIQIRNGVGGAILASSTVITGPGASGAFSFTATGLPAGTYNNLQAFFVPVGTFAASNSAAFAGTLTVNSTAGFVVYGTAGSTIAQNFDGLPLTGTFTLSGATPQSLIATPINGASNLEGWYLGAVSGVNHFSVDDGTSNVGGVSSYGATNAPDRALGSLAASSSVPRIGAIIRNTTASTLDSFTITFDGEQWRNGGSGNTQSLAFDYKTAVAPGTGSLNDTGFTADAALNFASKVTSTTASTLNGNDPANKTVGITKTISGLSWTPGTDLIIRWNDSDNPGNDDGLAIDNFQFSATAANPNGSFSFSAPSYNVAENGVTATITVNRINGSTGAVAVNYSTVAGGTAIAGTNYTSASGTLNWASGDLTPKTFTIPITDNVTLNANKTINIALSNPIGGASLGGNTTSVVTIRENEIAPLLLLNELVVNPPTGNDRPYEFVELRGTPSATLANIYVLQLDSDTANAGNALFVTDLSSGAFGTNGLLAVTASIGGHSINSPTTQITNPALNSDGVGLNNGPQSIAVIYSPTPITLGTDLDTNNDGVLDLPVGASLIDAVGWQDNSGVNAGNPVGVVYGPKLTNGPVTASSGTPDAATRFYNNNNPLDLAAWYNGDLADTGDPSSLAYDPNKASANLPTGALVSPGIPNSGLSVIANPGSLSQPEGNAGLTSYTFTISRAGDLSTAVNVTWMVAGSGTNPATAADFENGTFPTGLTSFAVNEAIKTITVNVVGDTSIEATETFAVTLSNPTNGATLASPTAAATIANDDYQALTAGDVVITGINTTNPDQFSFVPLVNLLPNASINFTDNGWDGFGLTTTEGVVTYTAPAGGLTAGTKVILQTDGTTVNVTGGGTAVVTGNFGLSSSGDSLLGYIGTSLLPTFLFAVNTNSLYLSSEVVDASTTYLPGSLAVGTSAVAPLASTGTIANAQYTGPTTGTVAALRALVADKTNWTVTAVAQTLSPTNFTFGVANSSPVNTAPIGSVPGTEDTPLAIATISVSDADVGDTLTTVVSVPDNLYGTFTANAGSGAAAVSVLNGGIRVQIVGSQAAVNAALQTLIFTPALNRANPPDAATTITVATSDAATTDTDTFNVNLAEINDAPVVGADVLANVNEDSVPISIPVATLLLNDSKGAPNESTQTLTISSVFTSVVGGAVQLVGANVVFTPTPNFNGPASFVYSVTDDGTNGGFPSPQSGAGTVSFMINAVNDQPSFTPGTNQVVPFGTATQQTIAPWATVISAGGGESQTLAFNLSNTNNGLFSVQPAISPTGTLTYTPTGVAGIATVTVILTDNGGTANGGVDATTPVMFTITVNSAGNAPTINVIGNLTIDEGAPLQTINLSGITDGGDGAQQAISISASSSNSALVPIAVSYTSPNNAGMMTFASPVNGNGMSTITVTVCDSGLDLIAGNGDDLTTIRTFLVTVNPVNDVPTFVIGANQTVTEDAGPQSVPSFATSILAGPNNENTQIVTFNLSGNTNAALFSSPPSIAADGTLTYAPAANASGTATVSFTLSDNGGTALGGVDTSAPQSFTITVNAVNDLPTIDSISPITINEDAGLQTVNFSGVSNGGDGAAQAIAVSVSSSNPALIPTPTVNYTSPSATGNLNFTPAANASGTSTITITVRDSGLDLIAGNGDDGSVTTTFFVTVNAVNDTPSFVNAGNQTVNEDAGPQTVAGFASSISAGPSDEAGQALTFNIGGNSNPALFSVAPSLTATGTLTYTPAANANGSATISVTLSDNGGGANTSAPQTFTITVNSVNDAPSFVVGANQTVFDNAPLQIINGWATAISAGPANEAGQAITFSVSNNSNSALFAVQPSVASNGTLTFRPAAGAAGTATITLVAQDNGGTSNGGVDQSSPQTFTITVSPAPLNAPPTLDPPANLSIVQNAGPQSVNLTGITAGGETQTLTISATSSNPGLIPNPSVSYVSPATTGTLVYAPVFNQIGASTITVTVRDAGFDNIFNNADDGVTTRTFTIQVNDVNDPPVANDQTLSARFNSPVNGTLTSSDPDGPAPVYALTSSPLLGTLSNFNPATGAFTYTPLPGATGLDTFGFSVSDGQFSDAGVVRVAIQGATPVVTPVGGELVVIGTPNPDMIIITPVSAGVVQVRTDAGSAYYPVGNRLVINAGEGNDYVIVTNVNAPMQVDAAGGDDYISTGMGDDVIIGGDGNDQINGSGGNNVIWGDNVGEEDLAAGGNDTLSSLGGNDVMYGGGGNDQIFPGAGDDYVNAGQGDDTVSAGMGNDRVFAGLGNDAIYGDEGDDLLVGGGGSDTLVGRTGSDVLIGGLGADTLNGDDGADLLFGGNTTNAASTTVGDANDLALLAILNTWATSRPAGLLSSSTAGNDGAADSLNGYTGDDDFYASAGDRLGDYGLPMMGTDRLFNVL